MSQAIRTATRSLRERQAALKPYLEEYERIQQALDTLTGGHTITKTRRKSRASLKSASTRRRDLTVGQALDQAVSQLVTFTQRELTEAAGVSSGSVHNYIHRLLDQGIIIPDGEKSTGGKVPARVYRYLPGDA